jgi:short-subunit dehydrogenase
MKPKVIVIGATSGIGKELVRVFHKNNYIVGATGRRVSLLREIESELKDRIHVKEMDITSTEARETLESLIREMEGVDIVVVSAGTGDLSVNWEAEKQTIETNVLGFSAMSNVVFQYFSSKGSGHLVGISSIGAIRGGTAPAYNASKAYVVNYLQGLRLLAHKQGKNITITDIQPGFIDTQMAKGDGLFWVAPPAKAASQIYSAICRKQKHVYVTKRWRIIAYLLKVLPDWLYHRL